MKRYDITNLIEKRKECYQKYLKGDRRATEYRKEWIRLDKIILAEFSLMDSGYKVDIYKNEIGEVLILVECDNELKEPLEKLNYRWDAWTSTWHKPKRDNTFFELITNLI